MMIPILRAWLLHLVSFVDDDNARSSALAVLVDSCYLDDARSTFISLFARGWIVYAAVGPHAFIWTTSLAPEMSFYFLPLYDRKGMEWTSTFVPTAAFLLSSLPISYGFVGCRPSFLWARRTLLSCDRSLNVGLDSSRNEWWDWGFTRVFVRLLIELFRMHARFECTAREPSHPIDFSGPTIDETKDVPFPRWKYPETLSVFPHLMYDLVSAVTGVRRFRLARGGASTSSTGWRNASCRPYRNRSSQFRRACSTGTRR